MIEVVKSDIENDIEWKEFLRNQYNLFYDHEFLSYNDRFSKGIKWHHLKFKIKNKNKTIAIMNGCEEYEGDQKIFTSCKGASFGGFLWKKKSDVIDYIKVINAFKKYLKDLNFSHCQLNTFPYLYYAMANEENEYALLQEGFRITRNSITNIVDLNSFDFKNISETKKRAIKKSINKIDVEIIKDSISNNSFCEYYEVLLNDRNLKSVRPTHSLEELVHLINNLKDQIILFSAKIDNKIVGICILFEINKSVMLNFYLATDNEYNKEGVSEFILFKSIDWAKQNNYRLYDIGTSDVNNKLSEGLFAFKKRFLANGFLRKTFEIDFD
jgi:hypothetical protein